MKPDIIVRGQVVEVPKTPFLESLEELLLPRGFEVSPMRVTKELYEASKNGYYDAGTMWVIHSELNDGTHRIKHTLTTHEYRLFDDPVDILNSQYMQKCIIEKSENMRLELPMLMHSMNSKLIGVFPSDKAFLGIPELPEKYDVKKALDYTTAFLDWKPN